jgi:hypothetical protein
MNPATYTNGVREGLVAAVLVTSLMIAAVAFTEPTAGRAQVTDEFIVQQTITGEISFLVNAADVTMVGDINGLTGGAATGSTFAVVRTNDPDGYNLTLAFPFATTSGMQGDTTSSVINNYTPATPGTADYTWVDNSTGGAAEFGYTVAASSSADIAATFLNSGSTCGSGSFEADRCWLNASVTPQTIINRTSGAAPDGATTTIIFRVNVPNNPSPALDADVYTATATLTATNN